MERWTISLLFDNVLRRRRLKPAGVPCAFLHLPISTPCLISIWAHYFCSPLCERTNGLHPNGVFSLIICFMVTQHPCLDVFQCFLAHQISGCNHTSCQALCIVSHDTYVTGFIFWGGSLAEGDQGLATLLILTFTHSFVDLVVLIFRTWAIWGRSRKVAVGLAVLLGVVLVPLGYLTEMGLAAVKCSFLSTLPVSH